MLLGCIADDLTGGTDLALMLARGGMRVTQVVGVPSSAGLLAGADAVVVSLKSRTIPAGEAVAQSLAAARFLLEAGARQLFLKYCSTFDSTDDGNIGPVAEALLGLVGERAAIACPAFPANGRTVFQGHLFVGSELLSESPMAHHPLTPMRDANLVRVLQRQTTLPVSLVDHATVRRGSDAVADRLAQTSGLLIADAVGDDDLRVLGAAVAGMRLVTGGSGMALGLPDNFVRQGLLDPLRLAKPFRAPPGRAVILAGSCSAATRRQVQRAIADGVPALRLDPLAIADGRQTPADVAAFAIEASGTLPPLVYSSAEPDVVNAAQARLGRERAGAIVEDLLGAVAAALAGNGFTRFVVAGGETSGAVVAALGVAALGIGPEIDPGVPWTTSTSPEHPLALALKSGNFGTDDFFLKALEQLR